MTAVRAADFGPLVIETDVDAAVIGVLRTWLPTYLAQAERDRHLTPGSLARPADASYHSSLEDEEFRDTAFGPVILVTTPNSANWRRDGDGNYLADFDVTVSAVLQGQTAEQTRFLASLFGGCVREVLVRDPGLGGFAEDCIVGQTRVGRVTDETNQQRFLAAGINTMIVSVPSVLREGSGPPVPSDVYVSDPSDPDTPYDPLVTVQTITFDAQGVTPGKELP
jgi:hypothetical protein